MNRMILFGGMFTGIAIVIGGIAALILTIWIANPQPTSYIIVETITNTTLDDNCEGYNEITKLRKPNTTDIIYKCGNLGRVDKLITFYK